MPPTTAVENIIAIARIPIGLQVNLGAPMHKAQLGRGQVGDNVDAIDKAHVVAEAQLTQGIGEVDVPDAWGAQGEEVDPVRGKDATEEAVRIGGIHGRQHGHGPAQAVPGEGDGKLGVPAHAIKEGGEEAALDGPVGLGKARVHADLGEDTLGVEEVGCVALGKV